MKLAIIGGGGVRVPLLVHGLLKRGLPFTSVALFDIDAARVDAMRQLTALRAPEAQVTTHANVADCVRDAAFVVTSIRVGGLAAREHDEAISLRRGLVGQETVGPGGFAMAVRTIPVLATYIRAIAAHAPDAWVINFTNPVGIITQAMRRVADVRIIGICDTPTELFAETAHALNAPVEECDFDYIGLNHLGWLREVVHAGRPLLRGVWDRPDVLARLYSRPLFPPHHLRARRLLPTEYVYYYDFPERAVANTTASGTSRGRVVRALTDQLFADLSNRPSDPIAIYEQYLAARSGSYMQIESGASQPLPPSPWAELTGYDRIAYEVIDAIVRNTRAMIPLNLPNHGNIPELDAEDVIEVTSMVTANGPRPLHVGAFPPQVRDLAVTVKAYERQTIDAVASGRRDALAQALASNPLVPSRELADDLLGELALGEAWA